MTSLMPGDFYAIVCAVFDTFGSVMIEALA
jgi:hypothetical protein